MKTKKVSIEKLTELRRAEALSRLNQNGINAVNLAEFMNYKLAICNNGLAWESPYIKAIDDHFGIHGMLLESSINKFNHYTLDFLKPVIDKIGKTDVPFEPLNNCTLYSPVELIYKDIIEFIDWYNKNR